MMTELLQLLTPLNIVIGFFWFVSVVVDYTEFCYIWQLKEYRWDKFRDYLSTEQGRKYFVRHPITVRILLAIVAFFWPSNTHASLQIFVLFVLVCDFVFNLYRFRKHYIRRPDFTAKAILIFTLSLILEAGIIIFTRDWSYLVFCMALRFYVSSFIVSLFWIPTKLLKKIYVTLAKRKMTRYPDLTVVGITGSYGKSSVKEFLAHILSGKFSVIATPGNMNTEIGIARFILSHSFDGKQVFIVEMGAYKMGEIQQICDMVHPKIGILTAIIEQHLALFGSIQNIQQAKYELLRSLPKDGLAVVNSDNAYCRELLHTLTCQVETFGLDDEFSPTCLITDAKTTKEGIEAIGRFQDRALQWNLPIKGEHNLMNLAPCVLVAEFLGMNRDERVAQYVTLRDTRSLIVRKTNKAIIIDDSYNSNPVGFKAALIYFTNFSSSKKRIVITRGMDELGDKSQEYHERIGEEIAFLTDELVIITPDHYKEFTSGVGKKYRTTIHLLEDPEVLLDYVKEKMDEDCVILLENRIPPLVYNYLLQHSETEK